MSVLTGLTGRARPLEMQPEFADAGTALLASRCARLTEEVGQLHERVRTLEQLQERVRALEQVHERVRTLEQLAIEDPVLPILSRKGFLREATRMLRYRVRHTVPLTLLYIDVDRFSTITDTFGQDGSEAVLRRTCAEVTGLLRASDLFGRVGVHALGVLLMHSSADEIADKSRQLVSRLNGAPAHHLGRPIPFTVSLSLQDCAGFDRVETIIETAQADVLSQRTGISTIETMTSLLGS